MKPDSGRNGILVVDKPAGFTSFDVVAKLRGICETRKIGHGGTLDPMATGVLPVFIGGAAKAVDMQPDSSKAYEATILFGMQTDTGDVTGNVLQTSSRQVEEAQLLAVLPRFLGPQMQLPPMYSAVKVGGKPLYKYAREGKEVQRKERGITIHSIDYRGEAGDNRFTLHVECSKGTYIRTLLEDIGTALCCPATLAALRRTRAGAFTLAESHTLADIQAAKDAGRLDALFVPVEQVFLALPQLVLGAKHARLLEHGVKLNSVQAAEGRYRVYGPAGFMGTANMLPGELRVEKLFHRSESEG